MGRTEGCGPCSFGGPAPPPPPGDGVGGVVDVKEAWKKTWRGGEGVGLTRRGTPLHFPSRRSPNRSDDRTATIDGLAPRAG
jgi:hypothetical protein